MLASFCSVRKSPLIHANKIFQTTMIAINEVPVIMLESLWFNLVNSYCMIGGYIPLYEYLV